MILENTNDELSVVGQRDVAQEAEAQREKMFTRIMEKIAENEQKRINKRIQMWRMWRMAAASVVLAAGVGLAAYYFGYGQGVNELSATLIEVNSPQNGITKVMLPDSTEVTLNGGTRLTYPSFFAGNERHVTLQGEGYFDVRKNTAQPFTVQTNGLDVLVTGTKFNLKSNDDHVWLTLEEGAVTAKGNTPEYTGEKHLSPSDRLVLNRQTGEVAVTTVHIGSSTYWMTGVLYFRNNTLEEIVAILEKKFQTEIVILNEQLKQKTYYCQFEADDDLDRILHLLSGKSAWKYSILNNRVEIR